jgi:hypothetical protein
VIGGKPKGPQRRPRSRNRRRAASVVIPPLGLLCSLLLPLAAPGRAQHDVELSPGAPAASEDGYRLAPLRLGAVETFLDAIAIEGEAALMIDSFWQPAIGALVAANPDKAALARSFGAERRAREFAAYRPLVAMMLDHGVIELLYPDARRRLEALQNRRSADYTRTRTVAPERDMAFAREAMRIRSGPAKRVNSNLEAIAELARTPDGIALRELYRRGYFWCARKALGNSLSERRTAECAQLERSPALGRIRKTRAGEKLVLMHAAAYSNLAAMVAMAHDPGISLHRLLPPKEVTAAGLIVPADLSLEELSARDPSPAGSPHD